MQKTSKKKRTGKHGSHPPLLGPASIKGSAVTCIIISCCSGRRSRARMTPYDVSELRGCHDRTPASPTRAENEQTDILRWWLANSPRFPQLSVMAADFCAAPATSVPFKEGFSAVSDFDHPEAESHGA
jgi:hypothetical protein